MLTSNWRATSRLWTRPPGYCNTRQQLHKALCAMSCSTDIAVAFKAPASQQEFAQSFKLSEGVNVNITQLPTQTAAAAAAADPSTASSSSSSSGSCFDQAAFFKHLTSSRMGQTLLTTPSIASTQEFMRQHASVLPEGAVLVADQQTRGKGRGGNVWTSPAGCLMFTALRRLQVPGAQAPFINYVVCLAVVMGIKEATQHLVQGGLDVQIKWPNDIYYAGVKVAGALIHTTWASNKFCVLTGIGLNVSNSQPTTCLDDIIISKQTVQQQQQQGTHGQTKASASSPAAPAAAASAAPGDSRVNKEQLLASVLGHLEACFDKFETQGFEPLKPLYLSSWMHSNQLVELEENAAAGTAGGTGVGLLDRKRRVVLTITGLSPHGFLLAVDALGQEYELTPDGNSLDMMQGLIKKKL